MPFQVRSNPEEQKGRDEKDSDRGGNLNPKRFIKNEVFMESPRHINCHQNQHGRVQKTEATPNYSKNGHHDRFPK
jgi:hypothetical protein